MVWSRPAFGVTAAWSTVIVTEDTDDGQVPFEIVQVKTFAPVDNPETEVVAEAVLLKIPVPEVIVQMPLPIIGVFAAKLVLVAQICWLVPATETLGLASTVIETSSKTDPHEPLGIVQRNTETPASNPVIWEFADEGEAIVPDPEVLVQVPPETAVAANWVELLQIVWSGPAFGDTALFSTTIKTSSEEVGQTPLLMVQRNILLPIDKPETAVVGFAAFENTPVPETIVQRPEPTIAEIPCNVATVEQICWSAPAAEVVGFCCTVIETSSNTSLQEPPGIVHRKTETPGFKPVT
jgi:hypothetical protein